ncbi:hypothetical protein SAMN04488598_13611 [Halanaerobium congolense]|uniref:Uncharacterized protein n=1 Tax=Halanaerobium congolense TaxID=54121 RepID=A0A1I0CCN9_9FIRM|nr:hypothetical protein [Halanaerobium congolense]SDF98949.1 hypothetical protein SAMN04488598_13611 [Halanaerobium congolense]SET17333.1 hypothetical protein SAMN04515652_13411 [Halanaerobium congolense]SFP65268.1 hypothetical protein SAMN04488596_13611 [Halanaerobium congolense]
MEQIFILFGYHIHHLYIGIALIALAGWFSITKTKFIDRRDNALIYGIGLGLFMDEIGLLLSWGDYWHSTTYLLSLLLGGLFLNIIFFPDFWKDLRIHLGEFNPKNKILKHYSSINVDSDRAINTLFILIKIIIYNFLHNLKTC